MSQESSPEAMQSQVALSIKGKAINQPITTRIPGWRRHEDKAKGLLLGWCDVVGFPRSYGLAIFDWFDKAESKWSFANAEIELVDDEASGRCVRVCCEVESKERGKKSFENAVHLFKVSELKALAEPHG